MLHFHYLSEPTSGLIDSTILIQHSYHYVKRMYAHWIFRTLVHWCCWGYRSSVLSLVSQMQYAVHIYVWASQFVSVNYRLIAFTLYTNLLRLINTVLHLQVDHDWPFIGLCHLIDITLNWLTKESFNSIHENCTLQKHYSYTTADSAIVGRAIRY